MRPFIAVNLPSAFDWSLLWLFTISLCMGTSKDGQKVCHLAVFHEFFSLSHGCYNRLTKQQSLIFGKWLITRSSQLDGTVCVAVRLRQKIWNLTSIRLNQSIKQKSKIQWEKNTSNEWFTWNEWRKCLALHHLILIQLICNHLLGVWFLFSINLDSCIL